MSPNADGMRGGQARAGALIPRWTVTAPHRQPASVASNQPWGVHHARLTNTQLTACGKSILTWRVFWHLGLDTTHPLACPDCIRNITQVHVDPPPPSPDPPASAS